MLMDRYLTFEYIESRKLSYLSKYKLNESRQRTAEKRIMVFLCHKHSENQDLIERIKGFFSEQGADLYIDWLDQDMPSITSSETAAKLKLKIKLAHKFVILATPESIKSIWMPWEIGLADQIKGLSNIAILPIVSEGQQWEKREYYQLYNRIEKPKDEWLVLSQENDFYGVPLSQWLKQ